MDEIKKVIEGVTTPVPATVAVPAAIPEVKK